MELDIDLDQFNNIASEPLYNEEFVENDSADSENDDEDEGNSTGYASFRSDDDDDDENEESPGRVSLESCLSSNLEYQAKLQQMIMELDVALENNRERQLDLKEELEEKSGPKTSTTKPERKRKAFFAHLFPYFQDKDSMICPVNEDKKTKDRLCKIDVDLFYPNSFWSHIEKKALCNAVEQSARRSLVEQIMIRKESLCERLLKTKIASEKISMTTELEELENELQEITELPVRNLFKFNVRIDWMKIANVDLKGIRSAEACQYKWTNELHPLLNKKPWTPKEDQSLKKAVKKFDGKNWDAIAQELKSERSAIHCCQRYRRVVNPIANKGSWSEDEKKLLFEVLDMCQYGTHIPWTQVQYYMEGRRASSIMHYWNTSGNPMLKRGAWSKQEDYLLVSAVRRHGTRWKRVAGCFGKSRSLNQCRDRYLHSLDKSVNFAKFTGEEDRKLVNLVNSLGRKWAEISPQMPGRSTQMVKSRFKKILGDKTLQDVMENLKTETDSSQPLVSTFASYQCVQYRDELHKQVEDRWKLFSSKKRSTSRKVLRAGSKVAELAGASTVGTNSVFTDEMVLKEAKKIFEYKGKEVADVKQLKIQKKNVKLRKANIDVDRKLVTMMKPLVQSQSTLDRQRFTALIGKNLVQFTLAKNTFYQALNVQSAEDAPVSDRAASQALEQFFGPMTGKISVLPPIISTLRGFKIILTDLNRLADSATSLENFDSITSLTLSGGQAFVCLNCSNGISASVADGNGSGPIVSDANRSSDQNCNETSTEPSTELECQTCTRQNKTRQKYAQLRSRFMAMFFWPALMSLVQPPNKMCLEDQTNDDGQEVESTTENSSNLKRPAEDSEPSNPVEGSPVVKKKRSKRFQDIPARKSSRLAGKES